MLLSVCSPLYGCLILLMSQDESDSYLVANDAFTDATITFHSLASDDTSLSSPRDPLPKRMILPGFRRASA